MYTKAPGCTRNWFWHTWYKHHLVPAVGRLEQPYTGPPVPGYDAVHDKVEALRKEIVEGKIKVPHE